MSPYHSDAGRGALVTPEAPALAGEADALTLPHTFPAAPRLGEVVLLRRLVAASEALRQVVVPASGRRAASGKVVVSSVPLRRFQRASQLSTPLPARGPLLNGHDLCRGFMAEVSRQARHGGVVTLGGTLFPTVGWCFVSPHLVAIAK